MHPIYTLSRCQDPNGGFAGGPQQLPHLAPTYAAVLSLMSLGVTSAYDCIDRRKLCVEETERERESMRE